MSVGRYQDGDDRHLEYHGESLETEKCIFCGHGFSDHQTVFTWLGKEADLTAHARCVTKAAPGLLSDIAECVRRTRYTG